MSHPLSTELSLHRSDRSTATHTPVRRIPLKAAVPRTIRSLPRAGRSSGTRSKRHGEEILVAVRSAVSGVNLENVCVMVDGVPYAPSGAGVVRPGTTSSLVELPPEAASVKAAVYFELAHGNQRIPLVTKDVFAFALGAVCVVTITDHTGAHSPSIEVEGAVKRLVCARETALGT